MFFGQNLELAEIKEFTHKGNLRFSYIFHLRQQRKYINIIGNAKIENFKPDMVVNIDVSITQEDNHFKLFVTNITPVNGDKK